MKQDSTSKPSKALPDTEAEENVPEQASRSEQQSQRRILLSNSLKSLFMKNLSKSSISQVTKVPTKSNSTRQYSASADSEEICSSKLQAQMYKILEHKTSQKMLLRHSGKEENLCSYLSVSYKITWRKYIIYTQTRVNIP